MNEDRIKEYVLNGGNIFKVIFIDTIRDGGTKIIHTTKGHYYVGKDNHKFFYTYPKSDEKNTFMDIITDTLLIEYLIYRIEKYINDCEDEVKRNKNLLKRIKKNNISI